MAEEYKTLHPIKYYRDYLSSNTRPDGRGFDDFRPIVLNVDSIGTADGSAIAKVGNTSVICGVKAELCKPKPDAPDKGFVVPNLALPRLCSQKFRSGPPSDQAQVFSRLILDIMTNSGCVDLKELCIFPDKLVWCLYIDLICLSFDGAIIDASIIALLGALNTTTLPYIDYDSALDNIQVNTEERKHLNVHSTPVATTFMIFDDKVILADPTGEEESQCTGIAVIALKDEELCCVHKPGGSPLTDDELSDCIEKAKQRVPLVKDLIETALKDIKKEK